MGVGGAAPFTAEVKGGGTGDGAGKTPAKLYAGQDNKLSPFNAGVYQRGREVYQVPLNNQRLKTIQQFSRKPITLRPKLESFKLHSLFGSLVENRMMLVDALQPKSRPLMVKILQKRLRWGDLTSCFSTARRTCLTKCNYSSQNASTMVRKVTRKANELRRTNPSSCSRAPGQNTDLLWTIYVYKPARDCHD